MWKSFYDFVRKASRMYGLPFNIAERYILQQLKLKRLTPKDVVCYINWADGDCLTQKQIGEQLNISQQSVMGRLQKLKQIWPHLFNFGPKIFIFNQHRHTSQILIDKMDEDEIVRKF